MAKDRRLFIDGSYFVFYRFFAIQNWYRRQNPENKDNNFHANKIFIEKYDSLFERTLSDLVKSYGIESWSNVFWCKDCPRVQIWRNAFIGAYKGNRDTMRSDNFDADIFLHTYTYLLPHLQSKYKFHMLEADKLESDDIIAIFVKELLTKDNAETDVVIITNDNDLIQVARGPNIRILNLQGKDLLERNGIFSNKQEDIDKFLLKKIILGDMSDNIPSIKKGVGPKTAEKLVNDPSELELFFSKNPESKNRFETNKMLIDFNYIDIDLKDKLVESLSIYL